MNTRHVRVPPDVHAARGPAACVPSMKRSSESRYVRAPSRPVRCVQVTAVKKVGNGKEGRGTRRVGADGGNRGPRLDIGAAGDAGTRGRPPQASAPPFTPTSGAARSSTHPRASAGADLNLRASIRQELAFSRDPSPHEYRDVTPIGWGRRFHDQGMVSQGALRLIAERRTRATFLKNAQGQFSRAAPQLQVPLVARPRFERAASLCGSVQPGSTGGHRT
jgi:hypothetical protein